MRQKKLYKYLGKNGIITTPILLEGINHILYYRLIADTDKILVNEDGYKVKIIEIPADEIDNWIEIDE